MIKPVEIFKYQTWLTKHNLKKLGRLFARLNIVLNGVDIGTYTEIGDNFVIHHGVGLVIGNAVKIGTNFNCFQCVTIGTRSLRLIDENNTTRSPTIGNNVTVYPHSIIVGPIVVGDNVIIGAHCIVMKDVPENTKISIGTIWG